MLVTHPEGVVVAVWVVPGASRERVGGEHDGALRVWTTAPPEGGRANGAVAVLVATHLGGTGGEIVSGGSARRKRVLVRGVDLVAARRALESD